MEKVLEADNFAPPPSGPPAGPVAPAPTPANTAAPAPVSIQLLKDVARKGGRASAEDPFWLSRLFYRKFTIYVTWLCIKLGINSNSATLLSGLAIFAAAA